MNKYIDLLKLKIKGYLVVDDFFPKEICTKMRYDALNHYEYMPMKKTYTTYWNYRYKDFDNCDYNDSLKDIADTYVASKISLVDASTYKRSWSFLYDNEGDGVGAHADPSYINVNIWVTPDECVEDHNKNGLKLYHRKAPKEWTWDQYNRDLSLIKEFLMGSKYDIIPYKCNRAIIFEGNTFHTTDNVHMKPGHINKRINYTFLYDG